MVEKRYLCIVYKHKFRLMIDFNAITQTKAFARQDGVFLSMLWIVTFATVVYAPSSDVGGMLMLSTPFFVAWRMIRFRNYVLEGVMSYRKALVYCIYTFFYASLLFGVALFVYFRFIDNGRFLGIINTMVIQLTPLYNRSGISTEELTAALGLLSELKPLEISFAFAVYGTLVGWVCSVFIAAFAKLKR